MASAALPAASASVRTKRKKKLYVHRRRYKAVAPQGGGRGAPVVYVQEQHDAVPPLPVRRRAATLRHRAVSHGLG